MTHEKMRIALAKRAGFTELEGCHDDGIFILLGLNPISGNPERIPNYPADLNAVAELEGLFDLRGWKKYCNVLSIVVSCKSQLSFLAYMPEVHATALQRCEALCRTWGIWEDEQ